MCPCEIHHIHVKHQPHDCDDIDIKFQFLLRSQFQTSYMWLTIASASISLSYCCMWKSVSPLLQEAVWLHVKMLHLSEKQAMGWKLHQLQNFVYEPLAKHAKKVAREVQQTCNKAWNLLSLSSISDIKNASGHLCCTTWDCKCNDKHWVLALLLGWKHPKFSQWENL